jgi:hypothetical protein
MPPASIGSPFTRLRGGHFWFGDPPTCIPSTKVCSDRLIDFRDHLPEPERRQADRVLDPYRKKPRFLSGEEVGVEHRRRPRLDRGTVNRARRNRPRTPRGDVVEGAVVAVESRGRLGCYPVRRLRRRNSQLPGDHEGLELHGPPVSPATRNPRWHMEILRGIACELSPANICLGAMD